MYEFSYISLHVQMTMDLLHIFFRYWFEIHGVLFVSAALHSRGVREVRLASTAKRKGLLEVQRCAGRISEKMKCAQLKKHLKKKHGLAKPITLMSSKCVCSIKENRKLYSEWKSEYVCGIKKVCFVSFFDAI